VVNQNSTNSVQLGNYYAELRQVPPQNVLRISWSGGNVDWNESEFANNLYNPLVAMLASRQLTNQIDYVVLSMDIPYRVNGATSKPNSTTSSLFYGFKQDTGSPEQCTKPSSSASLYAGSESIFRSTPPTSANSNSWLVTMITHSNLALAKQIVDSGANADGTFPGQTVYLAKSSDINRNVRFITSDDAVFNTRLRGDYSIQRTNSDLNWVFGNCLGLQQGVAFSSVPDTTFVPGSMADNLTSYGGQVFESGSGQLKMLDYLTAGASGTYGTVTEPCNYLEKFASPQNYFYQARGFSLAECYYQSLTNPYQGGIIGEPLAAPFAQPPDGAWVGFPPGAVLGGITNLTLQLNALDPARPVQQVDLFLDGLWLRSLTNIPPTRSNLVNVVINGHSVNYSVPLSATIRSVASGLTIALNNVNNATKVDALAHGDRIELQSTDRAKTGAQVSFALSNSIGSGSSETTWVSSRQTNFLDTIAFGLRNFQITGNPTPGSFIAATVTKTNATQFVFGVTNTSGTMTLTQMAQQLVDQVNGSPDMTGADGLSGQDVITDALTPVQKTELNLLARAIGWDAAQIQIDLSGTFIFLPTSAVHLDENVSDLQPRAHLYISAGVTNLSLPFAFDTTTLANGFHDLTAVIYEGSHVRTQRRLTQHVLIQNGSLAAIFSSLVGQTNAALEATLQFSVLANTNNISRIELFSTGGSLGFVTAQSNALFSVAATNLGIGLHPFYSLVTANSGKQYQTETKWLRIAGDELPIVLSITAPPPVLTWPALPGRSYDILSTTNLINAFQLEGSIVATNSLAQFTDTNSPLLQRFYRVRASN